jgi:ketosteroid isomerase-like protein
MRSIAALPLLLLLAAGAPGVAGAAGEKPAKPLKVKDKSKPVRRGLETWYARNREALRRKDVAAIMALRTDDFESTTADGQTRTRADTEADTARLLGMIDRFEVLDFTIGTIQVADNEASADVKQRTVRVQRLADGKRHRIEARAIQTERWRMTPEGWKLFRVDHVRDRGILIDGKPFEPQTGR